MRHISRILHVQYNAIAPFLLVEYKPTDSLADARESIHQIAISSYVHLVERQRLYRRKPSPKYTEDPDIRHYAYTICGTAITIWVTSLRKEKNRSTEYTIQKQRSLNVRRASDVAGFVQWHRRIVTWGL